MSNSARLSDGERARYDEDAVCETLLMLIDIADEHDGLRLSAGSEP